MSLTVCLAAAFSTGCDMMYYKAMKRFGVEKRDILVKRVRDARQSQDEAKEDHPRRCRLPDRRA